MRQIMWGTLYILAFFVNLALLGGVILSIVGAVVLLNFWLLFGVPLFALATAATFKLTTYLADRSLDRY